MYDPKSQQAVIDSAAALGVIALSSEHTMVIHGHEELSALTVNFPLPNNISEESIPIFLGGGIQTGTAQAPRVFFTNSISFIDTVRGPVADFLRQHGLERNVATRYTFDFDIYRGTPDKYTLKFPCKNAYLHGFDATELESEDRSSPFKYNGQISFHFYGHEQGNI
jgi:hypothetical protein